MTTHALINKVGVARRAGLVRDGYGGDLKNLQRRCEATPLHPPTPENHRDT